MSKLSGYYPTPINENEEIEVTRNQITRLLFETHKKCVNAAEEVLTLKELAKINNLYPNESNLTVLNITHVEQTVSKLRSMSDEELLRLSGNDKGMFALPPRVTDDTLEGEYTEVTSDASVD